MPFPAHLNDAAIEELGRELDAMREEIMDSRGDRDRRYILRLIRLQRSLAFGGRVAILASIALLPRWDHPLAGWPSFLAIIGLGTLMLALAKIFENMEIGHNVMHAQWDWMRTPTSTPARGNGTRLSRPTSGSTHTTSCITPGRTSRERTAMSATACCGSPNTSAGTPSTCCSRSPHS
jgi:hypothetical protein